MAGHDDEQVKDQNAVKSHNVGDFIEKREETCITKQQVDAIVKNIIEKAKEEVKQDLKSKSDNEIASSSVVDKGNMEESNNLNKEAAQEINGLEESNSKNDVAPKTGEDMNVTDEKPAVDEGLNNAEKSEKIEEKTASNDRENSDDTEKTEKSQLSEEIDGDKAVNESNGPEVPTAKSDEKSSEDVHEVSKDMDGQGEGQEKEASVVGIEASKIDGEQSTENSGGNTAKVDEAKATNDMENVDTSGVEPKENSSEFVGSLENDGTKTQESAAEKSVVSENREAGDKSVVIKENEPEKDGASVEPEEQIAALAMDEKPQVEHAGDSPIKENDLNEVKAAENSEITAENTGAKGEEVEVGNQESGVVGQSSENNDQNPKEDNIIQANGEALLIPQLPETKNTEEEKPEKDGSTISLRKEKSEEKTSNKSSRASVRAGTEHPDEPAVANTWNPDDLPLRSSSKLSLKSGKSSKQGSSKTSSRCGSKASVLDSEQKEKKPSVKHGYSDPGVSHFQDYLTRQVKEGKEDELYLRQKMEQQNHDLDASERKVKDLQLRLKRFAKDDRAKDDRILQMEKELRELTDKMNSLTEMLDVEGNNNRTKGQATTANGTTNNVNSQKSSKTCVIL